ncbi:hypothetical protein PN450_14375 [Dolichospermum lemmermannii CS-548]|uniref:hypothetical protein n=1 Tax=Dolichospermum lemmermannii TaxID=54295 RepID=UPI00232FFCFE|nr:hypothetical protein [Dolichospermum lemmermannii]MDB9437954.1 hypothetical protein [Dolichospermum lemmermannii CS-548]
MLVGAKHLEDKLSVIAKNSSPNASPVQRSIWKINYRSLPKIVLQMLRPYSCRCQLLVVSCDWNNSFPLLPAP